MILAVWDNVGGGGQLLATLHDLVKDLLSLRVHDPKIPNKELPLNNTVNLDNVTIQSWL